MDCLEKENLNIGEALSSWYYRSKFELMQKHLSWALEGRQDKVRIADIGCGLGLFLTMLEKAGNTDAFHAFGVDPAAANGSISLGGNCPIYTQWPDGKVNVALLMDVLEHVDDDVALLTEVTGKVDPGGFVFITVPAMPWLWSTHDDFLLHKRRYLQSSLRSLIQKVPQLRITHLHYYYASILPPVVVVRLWKRLFSKSNRSDMSAIPDWASRILMAILRAELTIAPYNKIAGVTVAALCQVKESGKN